MPKAVKSSVRELSLTSSFVAGGFSYHVDPAPSDFSTGMIGDKPLLFYRFEKEDRDDVLTEGVDNTGVTAVLSSSLGSGFSCNVPVQDVISPYLFKNRFEDDPLTTESSGQVRSLSFGSLRGVFDTISPPDSLVYRVDNASPTTSIQSSQEGADNVTVSITSDIVDAIFSNGGLTISSWIKPELLEVRGTYAAPPPFAKIALHLRPIFSVFRVSGGVKESLINFSIASSVFDVAANQYLSETPLNKFHRSLRFSYKNQFTGDATSKVTVSCKDRVITENEWQHVAVVLPADDGSGTISAETSFRFYVNGSLIPINKVALSTESDIVTRLLDGSVNKAQVGIEIGGYNSNTTDSGFVVQVGAVKKSIGGFYVGNIDDVALWNRALTGDEVAAIYSAHRGAYDPGSGYLNNPPRTIIRDRDNTPSLYPTSNIPPGSALNGVTFKEGD